MCHVLSMETVEECNNQGMSDVKEYHGELSNGGHYMTVAIRERSFLNDIRLKRTHRDYLL